MWTVDEIRPVAAPGKAVLYRDICDLLPEGRWIRISVSGDVLVKVKRNSPLVLTLVIDAAGVRDNLPRLCTALGVKRILFFYRA